MSVNLTFWRRWFAWFEATLVALAKRGDFLGLAAFTAEAGTTIEAVFLPIESLAACLVGNPLSIFVRLLAWAKNNPDPLATFRRDAAALQTKWTAALATPALPGAPAALPPAPASG